MNAVTPESAPDAAEPAERRLSFAFAKRHGVLVRAVVDGIAECVCREHATPRHSPRCVATCAAR